MDEDFVAGAIEQAGASQLTIDVDDTVVPTGLPVEGAPGAYNRHHPKVPSYYRRTDAPRDDGEANNQASRSKSR